MKYEIFAVDIKNVDYDFAKGFMKYICQSKVNRVNRSRIPGDKIRLIVSDILIRGVIMDRFQIDNKAIEFQIDKNNKPWFKGCENFFFNISHSGDWVVCVIGDTPVGIDVEAMNPFDFESIVDHYFTHEEQTYIFEDRSAIRERFYRIWSIKESVMKADGRGMSIPLDAFSVVTEHHDISIRSAYLKDKWHVRTFELHKDYSLAVAGYENVFPDHVQVIDIHTLEMRMKDKGI